MGSILGYIVLIKCSSVVSDVLEVVGDVVLMCLKDVNDVTRC